MGNPLLRRTGVGCAFATARCALIFAGLLRASASLAGPRSPCAHQQPNQHYRPHPRLGSNEGSPRDVVVRSGIRSVLKAGKRTAEAIQDREGAKTNICLAFL